MFYYTLFSGYFHASDRTPVTIRLSTGRNNFMTYHFSHVYQFCFPKLITIQHFTFYHNYTHKGGGEGRRFLKSSQPISYQLIMQKMEQISQVMTMCIQLGDNVVRKGINPLLLTLALWVNSRGQLKLFGLVKTVNLKWLL